MESRDKGNAVKAGTKRNAGNTVQVRAGARTYFLDVEQTKDGKPYLKITESRFKGEGKARERSTLIVFPEEAQQFAAALVAAVSDLEPIRITGRLKA
jgi:hypothetical protein